MIYLGLDDTDSPDSRGTNQLAKSLVRNVLADFDCLRIVRHQLLYDERIPYTSKNGSASIWLDGPAAIDLDRLMEDVAAAMVADFIPGSDPGLCVVECVPAAIVEFGQRCQRDIVTAEEAHRLADEQGIRLRGLGGTNGGVIGALAAVGLATTGNDGRIVQIENRDDLCGPQTIETLREFGVVTMAQETNQEIHDGCVDVGKKLRPNLRDGRNVLFVKPATGGDGCPWEAVKLT